MKNLINKIKNKFNKCEQIITIDLIKIFKTNQNDLDSVQQEKFLLQFRMQKNIYFAIDRDPVTEKMKFFFAKNWKESLIKAEVLEISSEKIRKIVL